MSGRRQIPWVTLWAAAFGVTEGAVVVYLRRLCYPGQPDDGPLFPLRLVDPLILRTEMAREAATLLMLLGLALLAERRPLRRFAVFALAFGVWDLAYYGFLHVALGWPASLMDWDVLFLIPRPWSSPVLAPVLVSLALVWAAVRLLGRIDAERPNPFRLTDWLAQAACGALILWSFLWDAQAVEFGAVPESFAWCPFLAGLLAGVALFEQALRRASPVVRVSPPASPPPSTAEPKSTSTASSSH
jgi:hypothetical protein